MYRKTLATACTIASVRFAVDLVSKTYTPSGTQQSSPGRIVGQLSSFDLG
jgi:hypothetical protein